MKASCLIPKSFHPLDFNQGPTTFDPSEGMPLARLGGSYVDGGISANIPTLEGYTNIKVAVTSGLPDPLCIAPRDSGTAALRLPEIVCIDIVN